MKRSPIEQRFRKELRERAFDPTHETFLLQTGTVEQHVAQALLKDVFGDRTKITLIPQTTKKRRHVYQPTSLENELAAELRAFLEHQPRKKTLTPLMATIPEEEILAYARNHHLHGRTLTRRDDVRELLETLQANQPQTKAALRKSFVWLQRPGKKNL